MSAPPTLIQLLEQSGAAVTIYDLGRRIAPLDRDRFLAFELTTEPYPWPMQRKAWFALVQTTADARHDPVIWFLRLALDEQGLLLQAERDALLDRLLGSARAQAEGADPQRLLQDNPYAFTPRDERMALFHALLSHDLGLPPSRHYAHALDYFHGRPGWEQWGFVGYQGIADVACRHPDEPLVGAIPHLPGEPLTALCHCLESRPPGAALTVALEARLQRTLAAPSIDRAEVAALLRGLSAGTAAPAISALFDIVLAHPVATDIEILATIAGRAWELLDDDARLAVFLQRLAVNDHGQAAFEHCLDDLLALPLLAPRVRSVLRDPDQPAALREAFGRMLAHRGG